MLKRKFTRNAQMLSDKMSAFFGREYRHGYLFGKATIERQIRKGEKKIAHFRKRELSGEVNGKIVASGPLPKDDLERFVLGRGNGTPQEVFMRVPTQEEIERKNAVSAKKAFKVNGTAYLVNCCSETFTVKQNPFIWRVWGTPLREYCYAPGMTYPSPRRIDFENYLAKKAAKAKKKGRRLSVLDIGTDTGRQWLPFIARHGIDLSVTSLTDRHIDPALLPVAKLCAAHELHLYFPPKKFNIIVAHYSTHATEKSALENIIYLLAPKGEALVSGGTSRIPVPSGLAYRLIYHKLGSGTNVAGDWFYHVRRHANLIEGIYYYLRGSFRKAMHDIRERRLFGESA